MDFELLLYWFQVFLVLLDKKDRGCGVDFVVYFKVFGEKMVVEGIEGVELFLDGESGSEEDEDDDEYDDSGGSDDVMESDGEDGLELIEDEEMGSDVEVDFLDEVGSDLEGKFFFVVFYLCGMMFLFCENL